MEETILVDTEQAFGYLPGHQSNFVVGQTLSFLLPFVNQLQKIPLSIFEDEVGIVDHSNELLELDDIGMDDLPHGFYFWELQALLPCPVLPLEFLDGDQLFGLDVESLVDVTEASLSQLFDDFVLLHSVF